MWHTPSLWGAAEARDLVHMCHVMSHGSLPHSPCTVIPRIAGRWDAPFQDLVLQLVHYFRGRDAEQVYVYIDLFAAKHHVQTHVQCTEQAETSL